MGERMARLLVRHKGNMSGGRHICIERWRSDWRFGEHKSIDLVDIEWQGSHTAYLLDSKGGADVKSSGRS